GLHVGDSANKSPAAYGLAIYFELNASIALLAVQAIHACDRINVRLRLLNLENTQASADIAKVDLDPGFILLCTIRSEDFAGIRRVLKWCNSSLCQALNVVRVNRDTIPGAQNHADYGCENRIVVPSALFRSREVVLVIGNRLVASAQRQKQVTV